MIAAALAGIKSKINSVLASAVWGAVAGLAGLLSSAFLISALFVWIEETYDTLTACLVLAAIFAVIAIVAVVMAVLVKRRHKRAAREQAELLATAFMDTGIELGRNLKNVPPRYLLLGAAVAGWLLSRSGSRRPRK